VLIKNANKINPADRCAPDDFFVVANMNSKILKLILGFALCISVITMAGAEEQWIKVTGGKWDLSPKMLSEIKTRIESHVKKHAKAQGRELKSWQSYTFQYQGQMGKNKRYIFINALCDKEMKKKDLSKEIIRVLDGGSCFFSLKYDPISKELFDIIINGEA